MNSGKRTLKNHNIMLKHRGQVAQKKIPFLNYISFSIATQSAPFPETIHKAFLLETVIFSQHSDAVSLAKSKITALAIWPASVLLKTGFSVDSIN